MQSAPIKHAAHADSAVQAVAVLGSESDRQALEEIFQHSKWHLRFAGTPAELAEILHTTRTGVIIADSQCAGFGWKDVLAAAEKIEAEPALIVTCRLADDRLWAEVLNLRGFDVLRAPFDRSEVLRCVAHAWRHWFERFPSASSAIPAGAAV